MLPGRLVDDVHETIKARIMDHAIAPGARVSIDGLARELGVSPTPVREALARLESAQLVVKEPLRGYRTTPLLTADQLADLYRFRLLIEPWAAATAAERATPAGRARLEAELATADAPEADTYAAYRAFSAHDARFHLLLAELAGSDQVREAFQRTNWHLHIYRQHYNRGIGPQALAEHRRIADAVLARDPDGAADAMREHLEQSHARLRPEDFGNASAESERAGAVPRGRRAGSEERATEHRRSGTAPEGPASRRSGAEAHEHGPG